jgi:hypothetical protein
MAAGITTCCAACKPDIKANGVGLTYFDLKGFFTKDTLYLNHLNKPVVKTVSHNGATESKKVKVTDWGRELGLFIDADINKPAWKNSYNVTANDTFLIYRAKYPELKMREMLIKKDKDKVKWILIFNLTKNILYTSSEKLTYYPDSLYLIEKSQHVKLMGNNNYRIQGTIER